MMRSKSQLATVFACRTIALAQVRNCNGHAKGGRGQRNRDALGILALVVDQVLVQFSKRIKRPEERDLRGGFGIRVLFLCGEIDEEVRFYEL